MLETRVVVVPASAFGKKRELLNRFRGELAIHVMHDDTEKYIYQESCQLSVVKDIRRNHFHQLRRIPAQSGKN